jgi:16S rRNA (guanine527-N7)-methyltransferase
VTSTDFGARLKDRAERANVVVSAEILEPLEAYFSILRRWNARMNLTALPLESPTDETLDRLIVEPLAAARYVQDNGAVWFDLGSGGGSPAIPLKVARRSLRLVMIESKARKAAFLREAVRAVGLQSSMVENARFEEVAAEVEAGVAEIVTVRAVKADDSLRETSARLLKKDGRLLMFRPSSDRLAMDGFEFRDNAQLLPSSNARLAIFTRVFHVEQTR